AGVLWKLIFADAGGDASGPRGWLRQREKRKGSGHCGATVPLRHVYTPTSTPNCSVQQRASIRSSALYPALVPRRPSRHARRRPSVFKVAVVLTTGRTCLGLRMMRPHVGHMLPVTTGLIVANVAIFLLESAAPGVLIPFALWPLGGAPAAVSASFGPWQLI